MLRYQGTYPRLIYSKYSNTRDLDNWTNERSRCSRLVRHAANTSVVLPVLDTLSSPYNKLNFELLDHQYQMASYQITEDLIAEEKGLPTDVDVDSESDDSDLSSEEEFSPESEESIQGPSTGFSKRGPYNPDCAGTPKKDKKDKSTPQIAQYVQL